MSFLLTLVNAIRKIVAAKRKISELAALTKTIKKIIIKAMGKYIAIAFAVLLFFGTIVYSITYAVKDAMDYLSKLYNTTDITVICNNLENMTEEQKLAFQNTIAYLDPQKIIKYVDIQKKSVPYAITSTKTTNEDGNITKEDMSVDVSKLSTQYMLPWQLVGAMDIITLNAMDINNTTVLNASNYATSQFKWADDVTRDETNYWKTWTVETESSDDGDGSETTYDGEDTAQEHFKEIKTPLGLADSVTTMFGVYKYNIKRDVVLVDEPYVTQLVSEESRSETYDHSDGTSETVTYTTYHYKKTRNTLIEDQATGPTFTFEPTKFLRFLSAAKYTIKDLPLLKLTLESLPSTNNILDMIDRIINGSYGDLDTSSVTSGALGSLSGSSIIPLFHQWEEPWGSKPYGTHGTIATSGCGPTSVAMVLTGLRGDLTGLDLDGDGILDPYEAGVYSSEHGYRLDSGTDWSFFKDIGEKAGLNVRQYDKSDYAKVLEELKSGHTVIASMGPGHFTSAGHFIVLVSVLEDGTIKVNDPNRSENSNVSWDFNSVIVPEALQFFAFDNPNIKTTTFNASAYTGCDAEGGHLGADGTELLGKDLRDKLIAVDKSVIPLGTSVYIEVPESVRYQTMPDGTAVDMNGYYRACDTGNAIIGNKVDIYFGTGQAYVDLSNNKFGRIDVQIYLN